MKKYQSHKIVEAAPIVAAEFREDGSGQVWIKDPTGPGNRLVSVPPGFKRPNTDTSMNPDGGDYLVRYDGGYLSWSPKDVFEAGYTEVRPARPSVGNDFPHTAATSEAWMDTAAQHLRNEEYYRGLVQKIGEMLGDAAFTDDGGELHDSVLCAKVPELVREALAKRTRPIGYTALAAIAGPTPAAVEVTVTALAGKRAEVTMLHENAPDSVWTVTEGQSQTWACVSGEAIEVREGRPHSTVAHKRDNG